MGRVVGSRRLVLLAPYVALLMVAVGLTWVVLRSDGYRAHDPQLHDGGVWVTSTADGFYGRLNKPINQLDSAVPAALDSAPDVVQDGPAVVGVDVAAAQISSIHPGQVKVVNGEEAGIPAGGAVQLAGGTLAVLDPVEGKLWAQRVETATGLATVAAVDREAPPAAEPGRDAALAVTVDGTVMAVSAETDELTTIRAEDGFLGEPATTDLEDSVGAGVRLTAVGQTPVVLDTESGRLRLLAGETPTVDVATDALLQQPGPDADAVVVAEGDRLVEVDLSTSEARTVADGLAGTPAQPVRLGACVFGAWAGAEGTVVTRCGEDEPVLGRLGPGTVDLVFRINRGQIVLNDRATGALWSLDSDTPKRIDDWESFKKKTVDSEDQQEEDQQEDAGDRRPPEANDDVFGARPGRTTVLHPLDNDAAPQGRLLSIRSVELPQGSDAQVTVSPDGQTVQVRLPEGATAPTTFEYFIDDGRKGPGAHASVQVVPRDPGVDAVPTLRHGFEPQVWTVPAGGVLNVPVLPDWRDYADGDPLTVVSAVAEGGERSGASATTTATGRVRFTAPAKRGDVTVTYAVSDGLGDPVEQTLRVRVQDHRDRQAVPPTTQPDVVSGEVGEPIKIRPLANDHPGSDPLVPDAEPKLAGKLANVPGAQVTTDLVDGTVTLRSGTAKTFFLDYDAVHGNSRFASGRIRVDVENPTQPPAAPVAMPDSVTLYGQDATLVDVLANDVDAGGRLLTVQSVEPEAEGQLDVAVVRGRWVRLGARQAQLSPNPQVVRYTISNGADSGVVGEIVVTQRDPLADNTPVTETDRVTVRAGAAVSVPVLDNDFSPSGDPLHLVDDTAEAAAGELPVRPPGDDEVPLGRAYVAGEVVRYVAPADLADAATYTLTYQAANTAGRTAPGKVEVTVLPAEDNQLPEPPTLEARVMAGGSVTLRLPGNGLDPDGDPVTITGIAEPPSLGRVLAYGANSIVFEGFPGSVGTDELGYRVQDPHGGEAVGTARVAVVPPAPPQPPLAVADTASVSPGRTVLVDVLANDLVAEGDRVQLSLVDPPEGVSLRGDTGPLIVPAGRDGREVKVTYRIDNGVDRSQATVVVRPVEGYNNPPIVPDSYGRDDEGGAGSDSVTVDVLADAYDPDGSDPGTAAGLTVTEVVTPAGVTPTVDGSSVTVPRGDHPVVVPVRVEDPDGGAATASLYVPPRQGALPYVRADGLISLDPGETRSLELADHVVNPSGGPVAFTLKDRIWPSPVSGVLAAVTDEGTFEVSAAETYSGPGAVSFEVTTGGGVDDPLGVTTVLTVPVQVGDTKPVLRCPSDPIEVAQGQTINLDVTSICHTWTVDPAAADSLSYDADWEASSDGLSIVEPSGARISVAADAGAAPGTTGTVSVVTGDSDPGLIHVVVVAAPPPSLSPVTLTDMRAGEERTINLAENLTPGVPNPEPRIVEVRQTTGLDISTSVDGTRLTLRTGERVDGRALFEVTMADAAGDAPSRQARSTIRLEVLDRPDAPAAPVPGRTVRSHEVVLSWRAPEANGAPVDRYRVTGDNGAGTHECGSTTCTIGGLTNGTAYTFTVEAHNAVGWSEPSPRSASVTPDAKPGIVGPIRLDRIDDSTLHLSWTPPTTQTSAIRAYHVSWPGGEGRTVATPNATISGLDNNKTYVFTVVAENALDVGPPQTSAPYQSVGTPGTPVAPRITDQRTAGDAGAVTLAWDAVDPNGPGPVRYTVSRNGRPLPHCRDLQATRCDDTGIDYDGSTHSYAVTATNAGVPGVPGGEARSATGPASTWVAIGQPADWGAWDVRAPQPDEHAVVSYTVPDSRGARSIVRVFVDGSQVGQYDETGAQTKRYQLSTNGPHAVSLQLCNERSCGTRTAPKSVQTVGALNASDVQATSRASGAAVEWTISWDSDGAPTRLEVRGENSSRTFNASSSTVDWTTTGTGQHTIGFSSSEVITIRIVDRSSYGRAASSTQRTSVKTAEPARRVYIARGSQCNDDPSYGAPACRGSGGTGTACIHASCGRIQITTEGFTDNRVTCDFYDAAEGRYLTRSFTSNTTLEPGPYYGYPNREHWIVCRNENGSGSAVESNHHRWPAAGYG